MRLPGRLRLARTTLISLGLAGFLVGLGLGKTKLHFEPALIFIGLAFALATFRRNHVALAVSLIVLGLGLGWWRGSSYHHGLAKYYNLMQEKVTIVGTADTDGIYAKGSQLSFDLKNLKVTSPYHTNLVGKISVKGFGVSAANRGDIVRVSGKLYPTRGSRQASLSYAQISLIKRNTSIIESARRRFQAGMFSALPEPLASFGLGLLVGQRNTLPQNINSQLSAVGLTHIVAVSGYNLTIIMLAVAYLLRGRSKYQATFISAALILLFLLFAGFSASIVRAAIVSGLALWAGYFGRKFKPLLLLLVAAALTAGFYPIYLWSDVGWYLSFLAFFGVLIIAPLLIKRIYGDKKPKLISAVVIETMSAQIMALPLIMYVFGQVSLIALPANILIVPIVPLAMLLAFVAALGGMFAASLAGWLAWPARIVLTYMLDVISLFAKVPHALAPQSVPIAQLVPFYGLVVLAVLVLWSKTKRKNATITDIANQE